MKTALLIVDVQNDFVEGGALAVAGGHAVAAGIAHLADHVSYDLVVASYDWHKPHDDNGGHIAAEPDYQNTWPSHCIADEWGSDPVPMLVGLADSVVYKGYGRPAYSAFEGDNEQDYSLQQILEINHIDNLTITGIATDFCVKATVKDALAAHYNVSVVAAYTAAVGSQSEALRELASMGAIIV